MRRAENSCMMMNVENPKSNYKGNPLLWQHGMAWHCGQSLWAVTVWALWDCIICTRFLYLFHSQISSTIDIVSFTLKYHLFSYQTNSIYLCVVSPTPKYHPPHGFPKTNWASDTLQSALPRAQLSRMSRRAVLSSATNPLHINLRPRASLTPLKRHSMLEYRVSFLREIYLVSHSWNMLTGASFQSDWVWRMEQFWGWNWLAILTQGLRLQYQPNLPLNSAVMSVRGLRSV